VASVVIAIGVNACGNARANQTRDTTAPGDTTRPSAAQSAPNGITLPAGVTGGQGDGEWTMPGRDLASSRYSPLAEINVANVRNLKVMTTFSTGVLQGHEGQPLVVGNTMYVVTPFPNILYSIDLTKPQGPPNWTFTPNPDARSVGIACCDIVNRGPVYSDGKIIYNTLDAHTVAVDAKSGKELWRSRVGDINIGETMTMAPIVVKNKVIVGNAGAELGVRGYITALDVATGKQVWKAYSTGPDADVLIGPDFKPFYARDRGANLGVTTWTKDQW
jgi:glucose dehydrogenase